jgi:hypothetical protein
VERHEPNPTEAAFDLSTRARQSRDAESARGRERAWAARKATLTLVNATLTFAVLVYQTIPRAMPRPCSAVVADMVQLRAANADDLIVRTQYAKALAALSREETKCRWR